MSITYIVASSIIAFILLCPFLWSCWMMIFKTQKFMTTIMNFVSGEFSHVGPKEICNSLALSAIAGLVMIGGVFGVFIARQLTIDVLSPRLHASIWEVPTIMLIVAILRLDYWIFVKGKLKDQF